MSGNTPIGDLNIAQATWRLDPARSQVEFRTRTFWGLSTVKGRFEKYAGTMDLSLEPGIVLTIEADSLDTGNKKRDDHLRSRDFFDAEKHPTVTFISESVFLTGDLLNVKGHLHAAGRSVSIDLEAKVSMVEGEPAIEAVTKVDHKRLGMSFGPLEVIRTPTTLVCKGRLVAGS